MLIFCLQVTEVIDNIIHDNSPPTGKSSNKTRTRLAVEKDNPEKQSNVPKFKNVKLEKV